MKTTARNMGNGWTVDEVVDSRIVDEETGAVTADELDVHFCDHCGKRIQICVYLKRGEEHAKVGEACARKIVWGYRRPARKPAQAAVVLAAAATANEGTYIPAVYVTEDGAVDLLAMVLDIERHDAEEAA